MKIWKKIDKCKNDIEKLRSEIKRLQLICPHERIKIELSESLAFDNTPVKKCIDCSGYAISPSMEEVKELYRAELTWMLERIPTDNEVDEFYIKNPKGFNY